MGMNSYPFRSQTFLHPDTLTTQQLKKYVSLNLRFGADCVVKHGPRLCFVYCLLHAIGKQMDDTKSWLKQFDVGNNLTTYLPVEAQHQLGTHHGKVLAQCRIGNLHVKRLIFDKFFCGIRLGRLRLPMNQLTAFGAVAFQIRHAAKPAEGVR